MRWRQWSQLLRIWVDSATTLQSVFAEPNSQFICIAWAVQNCWAQAETECCSIITLEYIRQQIQQHSALPRKLKVLCFRPRKAKIEPYAAQYAKYCVLYLPFLVHLQNSQKWSIAAKQYLFLVNTQNSSTKGFLSQVFLNYKQVARLSQIVAKDKLIQMSKKILEPFHSVQSLSGIGSDFDLASSRKTNIKPNLEYKITINSPQGEINPQPLLLTESIEQNQKKIITKNPYNTDNTGYEINRELFSDDDIREAFNIIDFNNDGYLSPLEISTFLSCMDQPHTPEEVEEMIRMVSNDSKKVIFEDFKKVGKGKIPPFAAIRQPNAEIQEKQIVLQNLQNSQLINFSPQELQERKEEMGITYEVFKQETTNHQKREQKKVQPQLVVQNGGMNLRTSKEIKLKKQQYQKVTMLNVDKAVQALLELKQEIVNVSDLVQPLAISYPQAKTLFDRDRKISVKEVILDVILFSNNTHLKKLWLILINSGYPKAIDFEQWLKILCFIMGADQKNFIRKRIQNLLKVRKIDPSSKFQNYFVLQIMTEEQSLFVW